jgi:hypothetical protein
VVGLVEAALKFSGVVVEGREEEGWMRIGRARVLIEKMTSGQELKQMRGRCLKESSHCQAGVVCPTLHMAAATSRTSRFTFPISVQTGVVPAAGHPLSLQSTTRKQ